jgi:hypothetical protein
MWFHNHKWVLVGKTFGEGNKGSIEYTDEKTLLKYRMGVTTYLYKCSYETCDKFRKEECIGKEVNSNENT